MSSADEIAKSLLSELEAISTILENTNYKWNEINGSINILKSKNIAHYPKIKRKLFLDFRMITDHQIQFEHLDRHLDLAYRLSDSLENIVNCKKHRRSRLTSHPSGPAKAGHLIPTLGDSRAHSSNDD